jgi:aldose 1-epimerase
MITKEFITRRDSEDVFLYHMKNTRGAEIKVTNYGAIIVSIRMPDRKGEFDEVALGYDDVRTYLEGNPYYFGCIVGRYANRIKDARFVLNGRTYQLNCNEGKNQLHGGIVGFHERTFRGRVENDDLVLSYASPDGEEKYPGTLDVEVRYTLTESNSVEIKYEAKSDADTIINLTNHSYFNLNGANSRVLDHYLMVDADYFIPTDRELIPTGELRHVEGTPFDFRTIHKIGDHVFDYDYEAIEIGRGYDNTMVFNGKGLRKVAELYDESTGRVMEVITDQPGGQFFTAHIIHDGTRGLGGKIYGPYYGMCLEPQVYPDSPNRTNFPDCVLRKDSVYRNTAVYAFSVR